MTKTREFSDAETKILISTYLNVRNSSSLSVSNFAKQAGVSVNNPKFQQLLKWLIANKCVHVVKIIGSTKILKVHYSYLKEIILTTQMIKEYAAPFFIEANHGIILHS